MRVPPSTRVIRLFTLQGHWNESSYERAEERTKPCDESHSNMLNTSYQYSNLVIEFVILSIWMNPAFRLMLLVVNIVCVPISYKYPNAMKNPELL